MIPVRVAIFIFVEHEMLDQGFAEDPFSGFPRPLDRLMRLAARGVDDIERGARHVGDHDGAVRRLALDFGRARIGMTLGAGDAFAQKLLLETKHDVAIFGMDERHGAKPGAAQEGIVQLIVVDHERTLVSHEMLEGVDAISLGDGFHFLPDLFRPGGDGHVEAVVAGRLLRLATPVLIGGEHG